MTERTERVGVRPWGITLIALLAAGAVIALLGLTASAWLPIFEPPSYYECEDSLFGWRAIAKCEPGGLKGMAEVAEIASGTPSAGLGWVGAAADR